ncbi:MAG: hypothetical protein WCT04_25130 [Planctomycetota bacterium]
MREIARVKMGYFSLLWFNRRMLNKMMSEMRQTVKTLELEAANIQKPGDPRAVARAVVERAEELLNELILAKPDSLKAVFTRLGERVELKFKSASWGRRRIRQVAGCDLFLKDSLTSSCETWLNVRALLVCRKCQFQVSVTAGTIFQDTRKRDYFDAQFFSFVL